MQKEAEYTCVMMSPAEAGDAAGYLTGKGYKVPAEAGAALGRYVKQGMNLVVCDVDTAKVALVGGDRAQLAGIRYWSEHPIRKLPVMLGLSNADKKQDLFIYVLDPEKRWEAKNYKSMYPPTNTEIEAQVGDLLVKERPSEYYNGITDLMLSKYPDAFLLEYAWSSSGCGMPCPNEPLLIHEMMSLGGDILDEKTVPEAERFPAPPEETDEEKEAFKEELKELKTFKEKKDAKKEREDERKEIARRKALILRQKYMISRMHYRYDATTLTRDPEVGPAATQIEGGLGNPKGLPAELPQGVKEVKKPSRYQVRFGHFHPWRSETMACEKPVRGRWGKRWSELRIWNHIWVADALSRKRRDEIKPADVVRTPIPDLGLPGKPFITDGGPDGGTAEGKQGKGCGCSLPGTGPSGPSVWLAFGTLLVPLVVRRRRRRS
jgi:MYXO-CTERM domain-containing protein